MMVIAIDSQNATILYGTYVVALGSVKVKPDKLVRKCRATNAMSKPIAIIPIVTFISAHSFTSRQPADVPGSCWIEIKAFFILELRKNDLRAVAGRCSWRRLHLNRVRG
jgi:hypothetical protein